MTKDRLVFFGTDAFSVAALVRLIAESWRIVAVVTKPDSRTGRGREFTYPAVKRLALASHIPVLQPARVAEAEQELRRLRPDAGIVVAYGKLIPQSIISLFPKGLINIHPSLLPRHRGATPIESAILANDTDTGITLMQLDTGMDTGPTYAQSKIQLTGTETRLGLYERLAEAGAEFLASKLPAILNGTIVALTQKTQGDLDWNKPAVVLEREIRAYLGWPGSTTTLAGTLITITAARTLAQNGSPGTAFKTPGNELAVYAGTGALIIDQLKPAGKREMAGHEFLAGHPLP
jgi:methionyl-tRNA formyltransferase